MNASYFLAHQPASGIRVYFEHCTTRLFYNPWRFWKIIDVDYLFAHVVTLAKPLDVERLLTSPTTLWVAVVDQRTGEARLVDPRASRTPLLQILKAANAIPVLYNRIVDVEGHATLDGGVVIPFPLEQALANGCTDVLVLLTRPPNFRASPTGWWDRRAFDLLSARGSAGLRAAYAVRHERVNTGRDVALGRSSPPPGANVATLCTDPSDPIRRTTTDADVLRAAALRYGRQVIRVFGNDSAAWDLSLLQDG